MTDTTQNLPDDASLFDDAAAATTLDKFENVPLPPAPPAPPKADDKTPPAGGTGEPPKPDVSDAPVPAGRLREEAERARRAERERDELLRQIAATRVAAPQPPPTAPPKPDLFENPSGFVQHEVKPFFEQIQQAMRMQTEAISEQTASTTYGADRVAAAKQALADGMHRGDPNVRAVWEQAMSSAHPYDVITRWHRNQETMREVGGDVTAYKQRIREEALNDPEFRRQVIEASKGGAQHVARPALSSSASSSVPRIPSLGNVGAGSAGEADASEPSDQQLFQAAVTARRR
jgi:hypothetical protein